MDPTSHHAKDEYFFDSVFNNSPCLFIMINLEMKIIKANNLAEVLFSPQKDLNNNDLFKLFPEIANHKEKIDSTIHQYTINSIGKIIHKIKDNTYFFNVVIYPFRYQNQSVILVKLENITDQIQLDENLIGNTKLISIGMLTAGVIHDINNAINIINGTIRPLKSDVISLAKILEKYLSINTSEEFINKIDDINITKTEESTDVTIKEIRDLLNGIEEGINRSLSIVRNLHTFSSNDKEEMIAANIHDGIDSTISLLHHTFKNKININKEYGEIPQVLCYPGKLNQVFMNILLNAVESMQKPGEIWIKTRLINNNLVAIHIKDTGAGIKQEDIAHLFDPFFTTKSAAGGTGLGLAISADIIKAHKGLLEVKSERDKGSEFIITLPVNQGKI